MDLDEKLRITRSTIVAIHDREEKTLRRKPFPAELVRAAKAWAEKLLDVIVICEAPRLRRLSLADGAAGPQVYANEIKIADAILGIIAEINDPIGVVMAFRERYPVEFAGIRYLPQYVRVINSGKHYFFYRRPGFEKRLPDSPIGSEFMNAYDAAERSYRAHKLHVSYTARPQPQPMALAA